MEKQTRLTRSQVISRLREHASAHGFVSSTSLDAHDKIVLRSIPLHFPGLSAARHVAGVPGPPYQKPRRKTGPKAGSKPARARPSAWSRPRVLEELRRLDRTGRSTTLQDLLVGGHSTLIRAAHLHAGGLRRARRAAGIVQPSRRATKRDTWAEEMIIPAIRTRRRQGLSLAATRVPQGLYGAARRHHGSWRAALDAAGIDSTSVRVATKKYTKAVIIERLRAAAHDGSDLLATSLAKLIDLKAVRREFGALENALRAAGLMEHLRQRRHAGSKWTRLRFSAREN
ncbi:MAG: hypothetical protein H0T42_02600 [Deltaproteobacteria bacterium]|nr:hypothetical protein [Deltaproteobacteria bacterium]